MNKTFLIPIILLALLITFFRISTYAQYNIGMITKPVYPDSLIVDLYNKMIIIKSKFDRQRSVQEKKLEVFEKKLKQKLTDLKNFFTDTIGNNVGNNFSQLFEGIKNQDQRNRYYSGRIDSLTMALAFLKMPSTEFDEDKFISFQKAFQPVADKMDLSAILNQTLDQRITQLRKQLGTIGKVQKLSQLTRHLRNYEALLLKYKYAFDNPSKLERILLNQIVDIPQFRSFFNEHSILAGLFKMPGDEIIDPDSDDEMQSRSDLNQMLEKRFGQNTETKQLIRQSVSGAFNGKAVLPNPLIPLLTDDSKKESIETNQNSQKSKAVFKRLEYGINIQSVKARYFFPVTTDIAIHLGYKINDKSSAGFGISYKLGWGSGWQNISISHQGLGLRSFTDFKLKNSLFLNGGFECNYLPAIGTVDQLKYNSVWQSSGLLGLSKKYRINNSLKGEMKLLWDFLSYTHFPKSQSILFRIGYSLN